MPVSPELLEEISHRREGSLGEVRFPVLLQALASHERTAVLEIRRGPIWKRIILEYGTPVDCRSNLIHETLGRFMVSLGKLDEETGDRLMRDALARGVQLGDVLRDEGVVDSLELFKILQQNLAKKLLDGFTWKDGAFAVRFDVPEVDSPLKVRVPQLVVTGVTRFSPIEEVNDAVGGLVGKRLVIPPVPPVDPEEIKLTGGQRQLVEALRTPKRLDEIALGGPLSHGEVSRLVYALSILGVVVPEEMLASLPSAPAPRDGAGASAVPPAAASAGPATVGATVGAAAVGTDAGGSPLDEPPLPPAELDRLENEVMEAYLAHRRQDAFDLLGLSPEAPVAEIRRRYLLFARRFAPWRFRLPRLAGVADKAEDLFVAGARAFGELMDTEQRNTLIFRRQTLAEERERDRLEAAGQHKIETDLLDSQKQFRKGLALVQKGDYDRALTILEFAADCDPQNSLYRAEAAWCRYLRSPSGSDARKALEELEEAQRIDPRAGLVAYYAGEIHRGLGNWDEAESHLRRANQLMAPDRRPIEALKILARDRKGKRR